MEKIIKIDGKDVRFKATGALPLRYKAQFGRDLFADMAEFQETERDISNFNIDIFYNIVWTMAKSADESIPDVIDWADGFDSLPIINVFMQLQDLLTNSMQGSKTKNK